MSLSLYIALSIYICVCVCVCVCMSSLGDCKYGEYSLIKILNFKFQARGKMFHSGFPEKVFVFRGIVNDNSLPNPEPNLPSYCILAQ